MLQVVDHDGQVAGSLPPESCALREQHFVGTVAVMVHCGNDESIRSQPFGEPGEVARGATRAVRQHHHGVLPGSPVGAPKLCSHRPWAVTAPSTASVLVEFEDVGETHTGHANDVAELYGASSDDPSTRGNGRTLLLVALLADGRT